MLDPDPLPDQNPVLDLIPIIFHDIEEQKW